MNVKDLMNQIRNYLKGQRNEGLKARGYIVATCYKPDGTIRWHDENHNLVVNEGLNYILDSALSGGTQTTTFYVGLKNTGAMAAGDTMGSHSNWTENTTYSQANRVTWVEAGVSSFTLTNSASKAQFGINGSTTIYGAFITTNNTKGGTTGTLICGGNFASSRSAENGDTLEITYSLAIADDGV